MGTEIFQFRHQGAEKKGFEVGNPMFENTTKLTFHQFVAGLNPFSLMFKLGWVYITLRKVRLGYSIYFTGCNLT